MHTIFHLDLDAFFVSVERILDPSLEDKPVIVGGDPHGRGVVAACSYEARKFGLHSAMPIRQAFKLCPHGIYLNGHFTEYENYSNAVKNILLKYAPMLEQASIDEFCMDFTGCLKIYGNFLMFASHLQDEIKKELFLPCSIGIASNKTVAKIASDCMKPKGITLVVAGFEKEFLEYMPVEAIPGVGKVTLKDLNSKGFYKIGDIAHSSKDYFSIAYGKNGSDLWEKANGKGIEFLTVSHERKSISKETTFDTDVINKKEIEDILFNLISKVCHTLREEEWQTSTISIKLRYTDFLTVNRSKSVKSTNDDKMIFQIAKELFYKACTRRVAVRLIGIHLSNLTNYSEQTILFDSEEDKRNKMIKAINSVRGKYGYSSILMGSPNLNQ